MIGVDPEPRPLQPCFGVGPHRRRQQGAGDSPSAPGRPDAQPVGPAIPIALRRPILFVRAVGDVTHHLRRALVDRDPRPGEPAGRPGQLLDPVVGVDLLVAPVVGEGLVVGQPDGLNMVLAHGDDADPGRVGRIRERVGETAGQIGEPTHRLQAQPFVESALLAELVLDQTDHPQGSVPLDPLVPKPPSGRRDLPAQQSTADALPTPSGVHAAGQVHPPRVDVEDHPSRPSVRHRDATRIAAQDGVDLGIGVDLVESLVQARQAVLFDRLVEVLDGGQQDVEIVQVRTLERLPDQPVTTARPVRHVQTPSPCDMLPSTPRTALGSGCWIRLARSSLVEVCRPPPAPSSVPRFSSRPIPVARGLAHRDCAGLPTTRRRPPR